MLFGFKYNFSRKSKSTSLKLQESIEVNKLHEGGKFIFLNKTKTFADGSIDWNYSKFGKLWTYNLNYFDFLSSDHNKLDLIHNYTDNIALNIGMKKLDINVLHERLGHPHLRHVLDTAKAMGISLSGEIQVCHACALAKARKKNKTKRERNEKN